MPPSTSVCAAGRPATPSGCWPPTSAAPRSTRPAAVTTADRAPADPGSCRREPGDAPPWVGRGRCRSGPGDGAGGVLVDRLVSGGTPLPAAARDEVAQRHRPRRATVLGSFAEVDDRVAVALTP